MADNDNQTEDDTAAEELRAAVEGDARAGDVAALQAEVADLREKHLRALADAENVRRRAERERLDVSQYAVTRFARDILSVSDNLHRALSHLTKEAEADASPVVRSVLEGVEATERELAGILERHGVRPIEAKDGKFDPHLHQAIAEVPAQGKPPGSIVDVVQAGYVISDRLLRPAMVTIARASGNGEAKPESAP